MQQYLRVAVALAILQGTFASLRGSAMPLPYTAAVSTSPQVGMMQYGNKCLGIDAFADMGYAVYVKNCSFGQDEIWVISGSQMQLNSCPDCAEPMGLPFCWGVATNMDGNPYFVDGQIMAVSCEYVKDKPGFVFADDGRIQTDGKCVQVTEEEEGPDILELAPCDASNSNQLFSVSSSSTHSWSGNIVSGDYMGDHGCLGITPESDDGYAVYSLSCEWSGPVQHWESANGQIQMSSCPNCVEPFLPFCWDIATNMAGNPYFVDGQIMASACQAGKTSQMFTFNFDDVPPPEAHGRHHIHHSDGQCVQVVKDTTTSSGPAILKLAPCDYDYDNNEKQLFFVHAQ